VNADLNAKSMLRYDGSGTFVGGDINYMNSSGNNTSVAAQIAAGTLPAFEPASAFADEFSWGYQVVAAPRLQQRLQGRERVAAAGLLPRRVGGTPRCRWASSTAASRSPSARSSPSRTPGRLTCAM